MYIGFLINPIAGMGGKVALKGTDGVYEEALRRGAEPRAPERARAFLKSLDSENIAFLTPSGSMGEDALEDFNFDYKVIYKTPNITTAEDTKRAVKMMLSNVNLIVFVGGDGTARDVLSVVGTSVPILGVPSGVKMYSSVFCITPQHCGMIVKEMIRGNAKVGDGEVLDIDEEAYRENKLKIRLYGFAKVPYMPNMIQNSKSEYGAEDEEDKDAIADFISEEIEDKVLYILGAGTTTAKIAEKLGWKKTLLGVDAYCCDEEIALDVDEKTLFQLVSKYDAKKLIVTPIGSQGFLFGRGNQQISERVLRNVGKENIVVVATPRKLSEISTLKMDLDDCEFLKGYYKVLMGYGKYRVIKLE